MREEAPAAGEPEVFHSSHGVCDVSAVHFFFSLCLSSHGVSGALAVHLQARVNARACARDRAGDPRLIALPLFAAPSPP
jgi:hypothetical protein